MRTVRILFFFLLATSISVTAQTAEEIIANYFENIGGLDNFKALEGMKMSATANNGGLELPIEIVQLKDGRQMTVIRVQGQVFKQGVYDGENLWSTNFQNLKAEKSDAEQTANFKLSLNDFPDALVDYKEKGYTIELLGSETIDGTDTFKVKLVKEPITIDGVQKDDISFYFFDKDNFVPIAVQSEINSGPAKGQIQQVTFSDYQEVDGLYFPFSLGQGVKGGQSSPLTIDKIELNPTVDAAEFAFPE